VLSLVNDLIPNLCTQRFSELIYLDKDYVAAYRGRADCHLSQGKLEMARDDYQTVGGLAEIHRTSVWCSRTSPITRSPLGHILCVCCLTSVYPCSTLHLI
jgi:hypothetical protein